jgi:hypothetical protein
MSFKRKSQPNMTTLLSESITKLISNHVDALLKKISVKYNIGLDDLVKLVNADVVETHGPKVQDIVQVQQLPKKPTATRICSYIPLKGKCAGVVCGSKISTEREFCYRHTPKNTPTLTNSAVSEETVNIPKPDIAIPSQKPLMTPTHVPDSKKIPLLVFNKTLNVHTHPETGLVFSNEKKRVIGILNSKKNIINPLSESDIELCKRMKFQYMTSDVESSNAFKLKSVEDVLCELSIDEKTSKPGDYEVDMIDEMEIINESGEEYVDEDNDEGDDYDE